MRCRPSNASAPVPCLGSFRHLCRRRRRDCQPDRAIRLAPPDATPTLHHAVQCWMMPSTWAVWVNLEHAIRSGKVALLRCQWFDLLASLRALRPGADRDASPDGGPAPPALIRAALSRFRDRVVRRRRRRGRRPSHSAASPGTWRRSRPRSRRTAPKIALVQRQNPRDPSMSPQG